MNSSLAWFDFAIIAVIAISTIVSLFRGFIREVMSLLVWILAIWAAFAYSGHAASLMEGWVEMPSARSALAFAGVFFIVLAIGGLINYLIGRLVDSTGLSGTDRMLGLIFGALRGLALVVIFFMVAGLTPLPRDPWWQESKLAVNFENLATWASGFLPEEISRHIRFDEVEDEKISPKIILDLSDKAGDS